jgi:hypothetical protein
MKNSRKILIGLFAYLLLIQGLSGEIKYPWKEVYIGALKADAWAGLVFAPHKGSVFAFRIKVEKGNQAADKEDIFYLISEVGPHSPDGLYARIKVDLSLPFNKKNETPVLIKPSPKSETLVLEWSRKDERTVIGKIRAPEDVEVQLIHYFPWGARGRYFLLPDGHIRGDSFGAKNFHYLLWTNRNGELKTDSQGEEVSLSFSQERERDLYFVVGVGDDLRIIRDHIYRYKNENTIDTFLSEEESLYRKKRVQVKGLYQGVDKAITNNIFWMTLYQPDKHRFYIPAGRTWIFPGPDQTPDHWTIFEWDAFFNALEVSIESSKHAVDVVKSVLETQYPNGNIPNWRGRFSGTPDRSQPPVGSYVVLKLFQKLGDTELLRYAYPYLKRWHSFWKEKKANGQARRDGNGDGLLEWGSDAELVPSQVPEWEKNADGRQRAMWESGQDDLPNWDDATFDLETGTLTMNCVDLNSLYALDSWCLAQMAKVLDLTEEYENYLDEYETMKDLINRNLWDEREGFYFDRYWDGKRSTKKAASNFYPLLARIPEQRQALRMVRHLNDPEKFWGDYVIPTISRDDPSFKVEDQQYWRGTIWPPTNYLVYQGLKAYHFDAIASEFAERSAALFLRSWENFQLCPENFDSRTGEAGGRRYQSWGPLFALIALEEYLDFTPWEGFRFGMIRPEKKGKLSRVAIHGRHYEVEVSSSEVKLKEEGQEIIKANGGAVFRHFLYSENEISFEVSTLKKRQIKVRFLTKGKYAFRLDNQLKDIFKGKSFKMKVPEGEHSVLILLLEKED